MRLFSEKVVPTFTSSNLNILTVEDYNEIFFDVFEFEINGKKFIAEKVSDYKGSPVVNIPLVLEGEEFMSSFVLQRGKFEVLFNKANSTFTGPAVQEAEEPIIQIVDQEEEVEDIVLEKKETILKEIQQARQTAKQTGKETRLFSEKVIPTFTNSDINILTVKDYSEIFFDVFEFEINSKKFIAEKVSDYKGLPIIDIPLVLEGKEFTASFVLQRGEFEILFNKSNATFVRTAVHEYTEPIIQFIETENEIEDIVFEKKETILKEIQQARQTAERYVKELKQQKVRETTKFFDNKQQILDREISESKKSLLDEFLSLVENVKSEFYEFNESEKTRLVSFIKESIDSLSDGLSKNIEDKNEQAEKVFSEKINELATNVLSGVLLKEIDSNNKKTNTDITSRFEAITTSLNKLTEQRDSRLKGEMKEILGEYSGSLNGLEQANVELNNLINKSNNKALSRIGNVKTQLEESILYTGNDLKSTITNTKEELLDKIQFTENKIDAVEKTADIITNKFTVVENTITAAKDEINAAVDIVNNSDAKLDTVRTELQESIHNISDLISTDIKKDITKLKKDLTEQISITEDKVDLTGKNTTLVEQEVHVLKRTVDKSAADTDDRFNALIHNVDANVVSVDNKIKSVSKNITEQLGVVNTSIDRLTVKSISLDSNIKELEDKIILAEDNIITFYDERINLVETKVTDLTEENKQYFINLIEESKQTLLEQISNIKVDVPNIIVEQSNGSQEVDLKGVKSELEKIIGTKFTTEISALKRLIEMSSGGGSVAVQFANGGTMNGNLNVTGQILSGGIDIAVLLSSGGDDIAVNTIVRSSSGNWNSTYATVSTLSSTFAPITLVQSTSALLLTRSDYSTSSATYATINLVNSKFFPISGGTITGDTLFNNNVQSSGNLTIAGNSALLGTTIATGKITANGQGALSALGANDVITAYNKKFLDMSARECYLVRFNQAGGSQTNTQYAFTHGTMGWGLTPLSGDAGIHAEFTIPNILTHGVNISSNTAGGGAALDWRVDHILSISISTPLDSTARDIIIRAVFGNPVTFGTSNAKLGALQSVPGYGLRISKNSITNTYDLKMVGRTVFLTDNMTGATNTTPITATSVRHGLVNGDLVEVTNVGGNIGANGIFTVSGIVSGGLSNTFILDGSVGTGTYTSGGAVQKITSETVSLNPYTFYRFFFKWNATTKTVTLHLGSPDVPASLTLSGIGIFRSVAFYQTAAQMRIGMFSVTANTAFLGFNYDTPKIMIL